MSRQLLLQLPAHSQAQWQRLTETRQRRQMVPCEVRMLPLLCSLLHLQFLMLLGLSRAGCWPKQYVPRLAPLEQAAHSQAPRQRLTETRQRRQVMPREVQLHLQHLVQAWAVQAARPQQHHYHARVWPVTHPRVWTWDEHR